MNPGTLVAARSSWRSWTLLSLLLAVSFAAHDLGMSDAGAEGGAAQVAGATLGSTLQVRHVVGGAGAEPAVRDRPPAQQCAAGHCSPRTACDVGREAVSSAQAPLDPGVSAAIWRAEATDWWPVIHRPSPPVDAAGATLRDQLVWFQVFLI